MKDMWSLPCSLHLGSFTLEEAGCHVLRILEQPYMIFMWPGTEPSSHQPCECAILEADSPAPVKPSDDNSPV